MEAAHFRSMYRQLLHVSKRLPNAPKRPEAVSLVRDKFRLHAAEKDMDVARRGVLAAEADSRLGFLKMMTPRTDHRGGGGGSGRTLYHKGEKIDVKDSGKMGRAVSVPYRWWSFLERLIERLKSCLLCSCPVADWNSQEKARWTNWTGSNMDPDRSSRKEKSRLSPMQCHRATAFTTDSSLCVICLCSVAKHQHLLNRAGFKDNAHAKGFF